MDEDPFITCDHQLLNGSPETKENLEVNDLVQCKGLDGATAKTQPQPSLAAGC